MNIRAQARRGRGLCSFGGVADVRIAMIARVQLSDPYDHEARHG